MGAVRDRPGQRHAVQGDGGPGLTSYAVVAGPDPGHAFPAIALARALAGRGHDAAVATGPRWAADVAAEGCAFVELPLLVADPKDADFGFRLWGRGAAMAVPLADLLRPYAPAAVVADTLTVAGWFAADLLGVPRVELVPHVLSLPSRALPPVGLAKMPGRGPFGKARDALLRRTAARSLRAAAGARDAARASIGLPPGGDPALRLVATLPGLEWPRPDWPAATHVVGPLEWEPPGFDAELPDGDGPLVLVADSTATGGRRGLVEEARDALAGTGVRLVTTTLGVRQLPLLDVVHAVVCAGGHGLLSKALARAVPLVVVPGPGDQAYNALRAASAGAAVVVPPKRLTPQRLRGAVEAVLHDPSYGAAAARVAVTGHGLGADHAAGLVTSVRGTRPPR